MKWIFYVIVFVYMFYRAVYGLKNEIGSNNPTISDNSADNLRSIFVEAGERKFLSCKGSSKNQKIEWINPKGQVIPRLHSKRVHASQLLVPSPRAQLPSLLLNISKAEVPDSGVWTCRAGDSIQTVSVCVIDTTDFEGTPSEVDADEGRSFTLSCQTSGNPVAVITWMKNGRVIREFDYNNTPKYTIMTKYNSGGIEGLLTIMSLTIEDSGMYTCQSTQKTELADECEMIEDFNITLNVNHAPSFGNKKKENVYGTENQILLLRCEAEGYPQPKYQWFVRSGKDETFPAAHSDIVEADNGSASVLSLKVTEDTFNEQYICQASNKMGEVDLVFNVLESAKPETPAEVEILSNLSSSKTLVFNISWDEEIQFDIRLIEVQSMPVAQIPTKRAASPRESDWRRSRKYFAPIGEVFVDSTTAVVGDLEPSTEYWVRLRIKNDDGVSAWSTPVKATTMEEVDDGKDGQEEDEEHTEEYDETETTALESEITDEHSWNSTEKQSTPASDDSGRFYGIFFAVGVLIVAVGCTFVARII